MHEPVPTRLSVFCAAAALIGVLLPVLAEGDEPMAMPPEIRLQHDSLRLSLDTAAHQYAVTDQRSGRVWSSVPGAAGPLLRRARKVSEQEMVLELEEPGVGLAFTATVTLPDAAQVVFALSTGDYAAEAGNAVYAAEDVVQVTDKNDLDGAMDNLAYPPMLTSGLERGKMLFCDRSCGVYINLEDEIYGGRSLLVYGNTQCMDMPWIGVVDGAAGDGMMLLVETPFDAAVHLKEDGAGRYWPQINWLPSLGTFRYPRRLSYRFADEGGYVALAKHYRAYVDAQGKPITLAEKSRRKPEVAKLRGAPIVWGDIAAPRFVAQARPLGMGRAVLGNAHANVSGAAELTPLNEMGYITTTYDSIGDILEGETAFQRDNVEKTAYVTRPGGEPQKGWVTLEGLQFYFRSSAFALRALQTYVPENMKQYGFNGRFMDVAVAMMLFEDYHPEHTFDRRQDQAYKRATMDYFNSFNVVVGTEHGNDWAMDQADYFEGATSGPFWWLSTPGGWNAGQLKRPTDREQLTPEYLKYGMGMDTRIPLWELVYHDCAVSTWYWGDTAGFMYDVAPDISEQKDLSNILYGTVPLLWRNDWGYGWDRNRDRFMRTYHWTCKLHEQVFGEALLDHRFVTPDGRIQSTRFASGTAATVNFGDTPHEIEVSGGAKVTLAPHGFYVKCPRIFQSRTWVDGEAVTRIEAEGYRRVETPSRRTIGPLDVRGTATMHRLDDAWHVVVERGSACRVEVAALTGTDAGTPIRLQTLDEDGAATGDEEAVLTEGWLTLPEQDTTRVYRLVASGG